MLRPMPRSTAFLVLLLSAALAGCTWRHAKTKDYNRPLAPGESALVEVDARSLPDIRLGATERANLRLGVQRSLEFLAKDGANRWYPVQHFTRSDLERSLKALDELLGAHADDAAFNAAVKSRFRAFMSVGCDGEGTVLFTGYYTPILDGSLTREGRFQHPLYKLPPDLVKPSDPRSKELAQQRMPDGSLRPYPSQQELDASGALRGQELVWLADPFDAYLVRIQGSARIRLPDGRQIGVGFAGTNNHAYPHGELGRRLVADGKLDAQRLSFVSIREFFRAHPEEVPRYTAGNPRAVFFVQTPGDREPSGCLGAPVTGDVSLAADKTIFPPAGPVWVQTTTAETADYVGLRLDQDAGGGIRAPGHADLYTGVGDENERRAGAQYAEGRMWYLIAR